MEKTPGRITCRIVNVFADLSGIDLDWIGLQSLIQVERIGIRPGKPYHQTNYYISSLFTSALKFAQGIREHWGIENRLHWVKRLAAFKVWAEPSRCDRKRNTFVLNALRHLRFGQ